MGNSGSKWLKPAKNKFTLMWFREFFSSKFQQIHIMSVSGDFISITSLCQTVASIKVWSVNFTNFLVNFTNFLVNFLADFWNLISLCGWAKGVGLTREGGCDTPMGYMPRLRGTCWRAGGCCCLGWTSVLQLWKIVN